MYQRYMPKGEFQQLAEKVKEIPILMAMVTLDPPIEIYPRRDAKSPLSVEEVQDIYEGRGRGIPNNVCARNPFRNDHNLGSFIINRRENKFTDHNWDVTSCCHTVVDFEERYLRFWKDEWDEYPLSEALRLLKERATFKEAAEAYSKIEPKSILATEKGMKKLASKRTEAYKNAVYSLAYRFGLITEEEYKLYATQKPNSTPRIFSDYDPIKVEKKASGSRPSPDIAPPLIVHLTLTYLCKIRHPLLSKKQVYELQHNRGVYEDDDYFSFPRKGEGFETAEKVVQMFLDDVSTKTFSKTFETLTMEQKMEIRKKNIVNRFEEQIENVPGFYRDSSGKLFVTERPNGGIGILYHDDRGFANGVQIRKADQDPGPKYAWLSASWTLDRPKYKGGASSGTPCGILWPRVEKKDPMICITEGRFKAEKIADAGNIAIYVSGVSTWQSGGVLEMIERIKGERDKVYIMFDADLMSNTAVHGNLVNFARAIDAAGLHPYMIIWSKDRGKGFDDLVKNNGISRYRSFLKCVTFNKFESVYKKATEFVMKKNEFQDLRNIDKEEMEKFSIEVQSAIEHSFGLQR